VTAEIPEGEDRGDQQQSGCQLAPGNWGRRLVRGLAGGFGGLRVGERLGEKVGGEIGCGIRRRGRVGRAMAVGFNAVGFNATIFISTILIAAIFISLAAVFLLRGIDGRSAVAGDNGRADCFLLAGRSAEIGENGLLLDLAFAQGGEIIGDGFFFVESDLAGVGADEAFVEDAAGKLVEVFVFEGAQHAGADFGGVGDSVEREAALLALLAKFFSERSHGLAPAGGMAVRIEMK
jgi:hypothetical protein